MKKGRKTCDQSRHIFLPFNFIVSTLMRILTIRGSNLCSLSTQISDAGFPTRLIFLLTFLKQVHFTFKLRFYDLIFGQPFF